jgi:hypothetical protein
MPDLNVQLRRYIDGLEEPVSLEETTTRRTTHRFRVPAAVLAGAAVVLVPALVLVGLRWLPADDDGVAGTTSVPPVTTPAPTTTTSVATTSAPTQNSSPTDVELGIDTTTAVDLEQIIPSRVEANAQLPQFPGDYLIDGDLATTWQGAHEGNLTITFRWARPVHIDHIEVYNIADATRFLRNYRIEEYKVTVDDLPGIEMFDALEDQPGGPQRISVASQETTVLTLEILSMYPAMRVDQAAPFEEVALAEIEFFGRPATG